MKKKILLLWILLLSTTVCTFAYDFQSGDLCYNITSDSTVAVASGDYSEYSELTSVIIPEAVTYNDNTYSVTSISSYTFSGCSTLTSITIPNSVTTIGGQAFYNCSSLTSITIPDGVTTIGDDAFYNVANVVYSGTATGAPWGARSVNGYVDGDLVYSDVTKTTLLACHSTATGMITIPNSVTTIGDWTFQDCTGLTSVTIPNSVTTIGKDAFEGTSWYDNQPDGIVYINRVLYAYKGTMPQGTNIVVKEGTTSISGSAFYGCSGLTSITIPNSVTTIGIGVFRDCTGLTMGRKRKGAGVEIGKRL